MTTYTVTARHWKRGWELHIDGVGVTQSRTLAEAESMVRDYLELDGLDRDAELDIVPDIGSVGAHVRDVRAKIERVQRESREAAEESRQVARELRESGLSLADTAAVLMT